MADVNEERLKSVQQAEKELQTCLKGKAPRLPDLIHYLAQYRHLCEGIINQDFEFANSKNLESKTWVFHGKINSIFRKELRWFRDAAGRKRPVEQRKTAKHFLDFIKSSQRYYRGYLQRLASRFGGIPELEAIANKLTLSTLSNDEPSQTTGVRRQSILLSCHQIIVRLGDLSRWRESQLVTKDRNWGPAVGYYDLARTIYPASGASHNQLAVIALTDSNHLRATYHLYRALAVDEPHPSAKGNLEIEFKKLQEASYQDIVIISDDGRDANVSGEDLIGCFMRLHARCYKGVDFPEYEDDEGEVLRHLAVNFKERSLEGIFNKLILINIAAGHFAGVRLKGEICDPGSAEIVQSFFCLLRVNVMTFITLLQILLPEVERYVQGTDSISGSGSVKLTAVTRRVLPGLRLYSSWLLTNATILAAGLGETFITIQTKELWKIYARSLTLLVSKFPVSGLPPPIEYLLEEDEDTLGFKPFDNEYAQRRYYNEDTRSQKPKWHEHGVHREHPNVEMLGRVRDLLTDGMILRSLENVPIQLAGTTFVYIEDDVLPEKGFTEVGPPIGSGLDEITHVDETIFPRPQEYVEEGRSQAASSSLSMDPASIRMVDDLVASDIVIDDSEKPSNPGSGRTHSEQTVDETSYGLFGSSIARELGDLHNQQPVTTQPLLPSILNSPFAPQLGEANLSSRDVDKRRALNSSQLYSHTVPSQQPNKSIIGSSMSSMPEPTIPRDSMSMGIRNGRLFDTFPQKTSYTTGGISSATYQNYDYSAADDCHFISPTIDWGCSGSVKSGINVQTPPNGQDKG